MRTYYSITHADGTPYAHHETREDAERARAEDIEDQGSEEDIGDVTENHLEALDIEDLFRLLERLSSEATVAETVALASRRAPHTPADHAQLAWFFQYKWKQLVRRVDVVTRHARNMGIYIPKTELDR